jgi:hypothetical protein
LTHALQNPQPASPFALIPDITEKAIDDLAIALGIQPEPQIIADPPPAAPPVAPTPLCPPASSR